MKLRHGFPIRPQYWAVESYVPGAPIYVTEKKYLDPRDAINEAFGFAEGTFRVKELGRTQAVVSSKPFLEQVLRASGGWRVVDGRKDLK